MPTVRVTSAVFIILSLAGCSAANKLGLTSDSPATTLGESTATPTTTGAVMRTLANGGHTSPTAGPQDVLQMQLRGLATPSQPATPSRTGVATDTPPGPPQPPPDATTVSLRGILTGTSTPMVVETPLPAPSATPPQPPAPTVPVPPVVPATTVAAVAAHPTTPDPPRADQPDAPHRSAASYAPKQQAPKTAEPPRPATNNLGLAVSDDQLHKLF